MIPAIFTWDGEHMVPLKRFEPLCNKQFVVGQRYQLDVVQQRSSASHNHMFACLHDAYINLPDRLAEKFASEEDLRKYCLIKNKFRTETTFIFESHAEAERFATYVHSAGDFCICQVFGSIVVRWVAKSQSLRAMDRKEFAASKQAVLDELSKMIGVSSSTLSENAGKAA